MFDPLISSYDKEVFEKERFPEGSLQARRLQSWEASLMNRFDTVIADTQCHVEFYCSCFGLHPEKIRVIPVGAEERLFLQQPFRADHERVRVLFYGSFIGLQGPEVIAEAARMTPSVDWMFVGDGPLRARCERICGELPNITFIPWIPYEELPRTISQADILLGVFGASLKASRVIPNKVYQALACGRMVVTQDSAAYPAALRSGSTMETGLKLIPSGSASRIADAVQDLAGQPKLLPALGDIARKRYEQFFSQSVITESLRSAVAHIDRRP